MNPVSLNSDELSKELVAPDAVGEGVIIYQEVDESGVATGRSATFADIEFRGLGYADLIGHTLGTPLVMPSRLSERLPTFLQVMNDLPVYDPLKAGESKRFKVKIAAVAANYNGRETLTPEEMKEVSVMEELGRKLGEQQGADRGSLADYSTFDNGLYVQSNKAEFSCRHVVERAAKNDVLWAEDSFSHVATSWYDQFQGSLLLSGNGVSFEDDTGVMTDKRFECIYDAVTSRPR